MRLAWYGGLCFFIIGWGVSAMCPRVVYCFVFAGICRQRSARASRMGVLPGKTYLMCLQAIHLQEAKDNYINVCRELFGTATCRKCHTQHAIIVRFVLKQLYKVL